MKKQNEKVFVSMMTDYGFKLAFGDEDNTEFLRESIQAIIKPPYKVVKVEIMPSTRIGKTATGRGGAIDVFCLDEKGNTYIIEMQRYGFESFIQRLKFYAFHEFNKLAEKGDFNFEVAQSTRIYTLSFLTGTLFKHKHYRHVVNLRTSKGELVDDQITHIFIELPNFTKDFSVLRTKMDKILYVMKYTDELTAAELEKNGLEMPNDDFLQEMIRRLKLANLTPRERADYARAAAAEGFYIGYVKSQVAKLKDVLAERKRIEAERKDAETKYEEAKVKHKEAETKWKEAELKQKETEVKRKEAESKQKEAEVKRKKADAKHKEEEAKRKEEEAKRKEEEAKRKETETKLKESILNLLKLNTLTIEQIANVMNVPIAEIEDLKKSIEKQK